MPDILGLVQKSNLSHGRVTEVWAVFRCDQLRGRCEFVGILDIHVRRNQSFGRCGVQLHGFPCNSIVFLSGFKKCLLHTNWAPGRVLARCPAVNKIQSVCMSVHNAPENTPFSP